jgi:hypothetical protein
MPFLEHGNKLYACCDACGYRSRHPRKDDSDVPQGWGGDKHYLRCAICDRKCYEWESEHDLAFTRDIQLP